VDVNKPIYEITKRFRFYSYTQNRQFLTISNIIFTCYYWFRVLLIMICHLEFMSKEEFNSSHAL